MSANVFAVFSEPFTIDTNELNMTFDTGSRKLQYQFSVGQVLKANLSIKNTNIEGKLFGSINITYLIIIRSGKSCTLACKM